MKTLSTFLVVFFAFVGLVLGQNTMSFQGKLIESGQAANGTRTFVFSIQDNDISWTETHTDVNVVDGLYAVVLGQGDTPTPLPQLFEGGAERQLLISVDGNVLSPVTLRSAYQNRNFFTSGDIGTNEELPALKGEVSGTGVDLDSDLTGVLGVVSNATGDVAGVRGQVNLVPNAAGWSQGVHGEVLGADANGVAYGVRGDLHGTFGFASAIRGDMSNDNAATFSIGGDFSGSGNPTINIGVRGRTFAGDISSSTNTGVQGLAANPNSLINIGVHGKASGAASENWAGFFEGDVKITGNIEVDGGIPGVDGTFSVDYNETPDQQPAVVVTATGIPFAGSDNGTPEDNSDDIARVLGIALQADASTSGFNIGVQGTAFGDANNEDFLYGVYGRSDGEGAGARYGLRGEVAGTGSTFPVAVRGLNFSTPVENGTSYGAWFDTRNDGATGSFNVGVRGTASKNLGTNVGVWGTAQNGEENWAGRFDGEIQINGTQMSMGRKNWEEEPDGNPLFPFFAFRGTQELLGDVGDCDGDPNTPDEPCPYTPDLIWMDVHNDGNGNEMGGMTFRSSDGREFSINADGISQSNQTFLDIVDPDDNNIFSINATDTDHDDDGNTPGVAPYAGELFLSGNGGIPNVQMGAPVWEKDNNGAERGYISLYGGTSDGGGWYRQFVNMSVARENDAEYGAMSIDGPTSPNFNFSAKGWNQGGADLPYFQMMGSAEVGGGHPPSFNVEIDNDGTEQWASMHFNIQASDGSYDRGMAGIGYDDNSGTGFLEFFDSQTRDDGGGPYHPTNSRMGVNGQGRGYIDMSARNDDYARLEAGALNVSSPNNRSVQFGSDAGPDAGTGSNLPYFFMFGDDGGNSPVDFRVEDAGNGDFGRMILNGPGGNNIFMTGQDGSADFSGSLRAGQNIAVKQGSNQNNNSIEMVDENNAGLLNVNDANNNNAISLNGSNSSITLTDGTNSFTLDQNGIQQNEFTIKDVNDDLKAQFGVIDNQTTGFTTGSLNLYSKSTIDPEVQLGSIAGSQGGRLYISSYADAGHRRGAVRMGPFGDGLGFMHMFGENTTLDGDALLFEAYITDRDFQAPNPYANNYKRSGIDFYDNEGTALVAIFSNRTEGNNGKSGRIRLNGTSSPNIDLGSTSGDDERGAIRLYGTSGAQSSNLEIQTDNTDEWGYFDLHKTPVSGGPSVVTVQLDGETGNVFASNFLAQGQLQLQSSSDVFATLSNDGTSGNLTINESNSATIQMLGGFDATYSTPGVIYANVFSGDLDGSIISPSDRRLKKNINTLENTLSNILKMRGVSYDWIDLEKSGNKQIGVIAQEVEAIYPELVTTKGDGMKSVNYSQMTAILIEAIKELNAKITALETENTDLKASLAKADTNSKEIETLSAQLSNLQQLIGTLLPTQPKADDVKTVDQQ
ncbi:MAG: tail fiber domain-containing protein [Cyclobacteriaceae bacterium]